jgi:hypothetical protein
MKKAVFLLSATIMFALSACSGSGTEEPMSIHDVFFANVSSLCGETFTGASTFPDNPDHALVDTELNVHIHTCEDNIIKTNLYRDGDTWHATWVLEKREGGLHLYHDHIGEKVYPEGEEPLTGYGGYANEVGTTVRQYFPADDHTAEILPEAATNVWMMELDLDNGTFVYSLERHDEPRFRAVVVKN